MHRDQYLMVCARRQNYELLLWQAPPLALAAQAFLLTSSLNPNTPQFTAAGLAIMSAFVAFASIVLMSKQGLHESLDARMLAAYELANKPRGYSKVHGRRPAHALQRDIFGRLGIRAYWVWHVVLGLLFFFAIYAFVTAVMPRQSAKSAASSPPPATQTVSDTLNCQR